MGRVMALEKQGLSFSLIFPSLAHCSFANTSLLSNASQVLVQLAPNGEVPGCPPPSPPCGSAVKHDGTAQLPDALEGAAEAAAAAVAAASKPSRIRNGSLG